LTPRGAFKLKTILHELWGGGLNVNG